MRISKELLISLLVLYLSQSIFGVDKQKLDELKQKSGNDPSAFYELGSIHLQSSKIEDKDKSFEWFKKGAEKGHAPCMYELAVMYSEGLWSELDLKKSLMWFEMAAKKGLKKAQFNAGILYLDYEPNIPQDVDKGLKYLIKAADEHELNAIERLAIIYQEGKLVKKDLIKAIEYYKAGIKRDSRVAKFSYGVLLLKGDGDIKKDHDKGLMLIIESAEAKLGNAILFLAQEYYDKDGFLKRNLEKSLKWYTFGAAHQLPTTVEMVKKVNEEIKFEEKNGPIEYSKEDLKKLLELED